jgi:predicted house-cleaning noncanonical NTP pyrophosphatase (MazG superfamily)
MDESLERATTPNKKQPIIYQTLTANRSLVVISPSGVSSVAPEQLSSETVGVKALGLCSLPDQWVPPFFVTTGDSIASSLTDDELTPYIELALDTCGISTSKVIIRSNGVDETILDRGRLESTPCGRDEIVATLRKLFEHAAPLSGTVHWIVQAFVEEKLKGQLSNERRVKLERRDWIAEVEPTSIQRGYQSSIAIRGWRDGTTVSDLSLACTSETEITLRLKRVAMWAMSFSSRLLFEWVWDGLMLYMVQVDNADPIGGVEPNELLPKTADQLSPTDLSIFCSADDSHYQQYGKLRNARVYRGIGYTMPAFYILAQKDVIDSILQGVITDALMADLEKLTRRPLILRTDGLQLPDEKWEMLPRSEELRSADAAKSWLLDGFAPKIREVGLENYDLCLIAHHFIPSVSSAWARAEPGKRWVRIESLWGIPEGLYWYSHDTFEVDTVDANFTKAKVAGVRYPYRERLRYKGTFVAPNEAGVWVRHQPKVPHDWGRSVTNAHWLTEIAHTTRQIAEAADTPVSVMWFIDNHPQATTHRVLPWYHSPCPLDETPKAAPQNKIRSALDFKIENKEDWEKFRLALNAGTRIERVIVQPLDSELIRNPKFADEFAHLAALNNVVVVLAGGILSHAYHALKRSGAQVECVDLFGAEEEIVEYNKVVRDKVPAKIERGGERVEVVQLTGEALITALRRKLVEEALEALDAKPGEDLVGELADVEEVLRALSAAIGVSKEQLDKERKSKSKRRGAFDQGYMLIKTATPHSLQKRSTEATLELKDVPSSNQKISRSAALPAKPFYRRPDLRNVDQQAEKLFTFETELNQIGVVSESAVFRMPVGEESHEFTLTLDIRRNRSLIRGIVKLRVGDKQGTSSVLDLQPELPFDSEAAE